MIDGSVLMHYWLSLTTRPVLSVCTTDEMMVTDLTQPKLVTSLDAPLAHTISDCRVCCKHTLSHCDCGSTAAVCCKVAEAEAAALAHQCSSWCLRPSCSPCCIHTGRPWRVLDLRSMCHWSWQRISTGCHRGPTLYGEGISNKQARGQKVQGEASKANDCTTTMQYYS